LQKLYSEDNFKDAALSVVNMMMICVWMSVIAVNILHFSTDICIFNTGICLWINKLYCNRLKWR